MIQKTKLFRKLFLTVSVFAAVVAFSTAAFANEVVGQTGNSTVGIFNDGNRMEFINLPFVENDTVYMPLRELMQKLGMDDKTGIVWDNGSITLYLDGHLDYYVIEIDKKQIQYDSLEHLPNALAIRDVENPPLLVHDLTYIPYEYLDFIFNRFGGSYLIDYEIYDSNNKKIGFSTIPVSLFDEKFCIEVPTSWVGKFGTMVGDDANEVQFVQSAAYIKYGVGTLFRIQKVELSTADELLNMLGGSKLLYQEGEYAYLFIIPTDVQAPIWDGSDEEDAKIAEEYQKLYADVEKIAGSFKPVGAETF